MANSYDPIISKEKVDKFSLIQPRPVPEAGVDLVLVGPRLVHITLDKPLTAGEFRWGEIREVFRVKVSEFHFSIGCPLPSRDSAHEFQAEADVVCAVADPRFIVQRGTRDIRETLEPLIKDSMRKASINYPVEKWAQAEAEILSTIRSDSQNYGTGIVIHRLVIRIKPDQATLGHLQSRVELERKLELDRVRTNAENEIRGVNVSHWEELIGRGECALFASHLGNNPNDAASVLGSIRNMRHEDLGAMLKALDVFLDKGGLQSDEKARPARKILEQVTSALKQRLETPLLGGIKMPLLPDVKTPAREDSSERTDAKPTDNKLEIKTPIPPRS